MSTLGRHLPVAVFVSAALAVLPLRAEPLSVDVALATGVTLTVDEVDLWSERLGEKVILGVAARAPDGVGGQPVAEAELRALCRHLPELITLLAERPARQPTHLQLLYRNPSGRYASAYSEGLRINIHRSRCDR
ncbi:MAG: hypothetical protein AAFW69_05040 [Pseudomonadota bacterium]